MKSPRSLLGSPLAGFLLLALPLGAQPAAPARNPSDKNDEVVKLSEFSVSANADRGYIASETVSGSRVATAIKDLPYNVNVVTSEFMEDFGTFEGTTHAFAYTSSVAAIDLSGTGNSTIRGYSSQY